VGHERTWCWSSERAGIDYPAKGFATWRTASMKSRATGLIVLAFKVIIPIGSGKIGNLIGKALIEGCLPRKRTVDAGRIDK
jgi:hypothetical protein